jgi:SAM-dependent methyltransferase
VDDFVEQLWRLVLRRAPDPETAGRLERGEVSRARLVRELVESREFERIELLDDGLARARLERGRRGRPRELRAPSWSDERAIEIPWCLARYHGEARVLDVGSANAERAYLEGLEALEAPELVKVDLAEPADVIADVRSLPFDDGHFDLAVCISTLEHIGRDNAVYGVENAHDDEGHATALRELHRVLARTGRLLFSVPTGVHEDHGWHLQRAPLEWIELFEQSGFVVFEDELYLHTADGWRTATLTEAEAARYESGGPGAGAVLLAELRPRRLSEKVRLAVRDVRRPDEPRRSTAAKASEHAVSNPATTRKNTRSET